MLLFPLVPGQPLIFVAAVPRGYQLSPVMLSDGSVWVLPLDPDNGPHLMLLPPPLYSAH